MTVSPAELQGHGRDEKVTVDARKYKAMRRQLLRMVLGYVAVEREVCRILESCQHAEGCEAVNDRARPCQHDCPDRETWLSALVVLGNAREYTPMRGSLPSRLGDDYSPPPREYFDQVVTELELLREGPDVLEELARYARAGVKMAPDLDTAQRAPELPLTRLVDTTDDDEEDDGRTLVEIVHGHGQELATPSAENIESGGSK